MGSNVSSNHTDGPLSSPQNNSNTSPNEQISSSEPTQSHVYINDKFRLEFLDCNCCCDTTKKVANCDFQGINILRDLYEMVEAPEYKLNCRCSCGDDIGNRKESLKFGLTGTPNAHITCDGLDLSCPTSSDSGIKQ